MNYLSPIGTLRAKAVRPRLPSIGTTSMLLAVAMTLAACASTPNVVQYYYFPKAATQLTVTQTFACPISTTANKSPSNLSVVATVSQSTAYTADHGQSTGVVDFGATSGALSDTDMTVNLSDDGRLTGINSSSSGEGDKIAQEIITLAAVAGVGGVAAAENGQVLRKQPCDVIREHFGGDSTKNPPTAIVTYTINLLYGQPAPAPAPAPQGPTATGGPADTPDTILLEADPSTNAVIPANESGFQKTLTIQPDASSQALLHELEQSQLNGSNLFEFEVSIAGSSREVVGAKLKDSTTSSSPSSIKLNQVSIVDLEVDGPAPDPKAPAISIWKTQVAVPERLYYDLPIPTGAVFGKTQFSLSLAGAGSISKLEYGTTSGSTDAADLAGAIAKSAKGPSAAQEASAVQAKADLVYENQRLAICKATPASCPSK